MYSIVADAYRTASEENGYDLDFLSAHEVAIDMLSYCSDLESADLDDVIRAIIRYRGY